jgi:hypothetical protein
MGATRRDAPMVCRLEVLGGRPWQLQVSSDGIAVEVVRPRARALVEARLDAPAWRAVSHGARSLFIALKRRYSSNYHNNGKIFLSQRDASKKIGSGTEEITRWFREKSKDGQGARPRRADDITRQEVIE